MTYRHRLIVSLFTITLVSIPFQGESFILPDITNTKALQDYNGGLFCNGVEVGGKAFGIYFPKASKRQDVRARFCQKGKLIYKPEIIVNVTFPGLKGMAIDQAAQVKEGIINYLEKGLSQFFLDETELPPDQETGLSCLTEKSSDSAHPNEQAQSKTGSALQNDGSLVVIKDFFDNSSNPYLAVFFELSEQDQIRDIHARYGSFLASKVEVYNEAPKIYTFDGINGIPLGEFKPADRHQYWVKKDEDGGKIFAPAYFKDLRELRDKYVLVSDPSVPPSKLLAQSEKQWSEFIANSTKVTKQVMQNGVRFLLSLDFGEMCSQMVEKSDLTEK